LEKTIEFRVLGENGFQLYANQWVDSPSQGDAKFSRIKIANLSHHWWRGTVMSGSFIIEYADSQKLEGSFEAKYVKPPSQLICE